MTARTRSMVLCIVCVMIVMQKEITVKKILIFVTAIGLLASCASQAKVDPDALAYQKIIEKPGAAAGELYEKSHRWIAETFQSSKAVIEYANKEEGQIIGNGVVDVVYAFAPSPTEFTLNLEVRDGRLRATFKNMRFVGQGSWVPFDNRLQLEKFSAEAARLVDSLDAYLSKPSSDW